MCSFSGPPPMTAAWGEEGRGGEEGRREVSIVVEMMVGKETRKAKQDPEGAVWA